MTESEASNKRQEAYFVFREVVRKWKGRLTKGTLLDAFRDISETDDAWKRDREQCPTCLFTPCKCAEINGVENGHGPRTYSNLIAEVAGRGGWWKSIIEAEDKQIVNREDAPIETGKPAVHDAKILADAFTVARAWMGANQPTWEEWLSAFDRLAETGKPAGKGAGHED